MSPRSELIAKIARILGRPETRSFGNHIRPISDPGIKKNLRGNLHSEDAPQVFNLMKENVKDVYDGLNKMNDNYNLNPHKEYEPVHFYLNKREKEVWDSIDNILLVAEKNRKTAFFHIGNKGSGKTITQNCWLLKNHRELEKRNIFWVRCDAHKLYLMWQERDRLGQTGELVTVGQYLDIQFLYVFVKHYLLEKSTPWQEQGTNKFAELYRQINDSGATYLHQSRKLHGASISSLLSAGIDDIKPNIENEANRGLSGRYSYALDEIMKPAHTSGNIHRAAFNNWISMSKALQHQLTLKGVKFLKLVDGIDNINLMDVQNKRYYSTMIEEVHSCASSMIDSEIFFVAMRERTFADMKEMARISDRFLATDAGSVFQEIPHQTSNVSDIVDRRKAYFENRGEVGIMGNLRDEGSHVFFKIFKEVLSECSAIDNEIFHNNIRAFMHHRLCLAAHTYYRWLQIGKRENEFAGIIKYLKDRTKLLNERFFLDSKETYALGGYKRYLPNIFYYPEDKCAGGHWHGLCSMRIFQAIMLFGEMDLEKIPGYLSDLFGYQPEIVGSGIEMLRNFGFIDSKYDDKSSDVKSGKTYFVCSTKGKNYLPVYFEDFDIIYFCALDTPLPQEFITQRLVMAHDNKIDANALSGGGAKLFPYETNYPLASIASVVTFLKYLKINYEREQDNLSRRHIDQSKYEIRPLENIQAIFERASSLIDEHFAEPVGKKLDGIDEYFSRQDPAENSG